MQLLKLAPVLMLTLAVGCATTTEKKVEKDIAQQPEATSAQAVDSGRLAITNSPQLTPEQKAKMLAILEQARAEMAVIRKEEAQVKSSLFKYLAAGNFENREIAVYRTKLKKLEDKKMELMFANLKQTRTALGKDTKIDPDLFDFERFNSERL